MKLNKKQLEWIRDLFDEGCSCIKSEYGLEAWQIQAQQWFQQFINSQLMEVSK